MNLHKKYYQIIYFYNHILPEAMSAPKIIRVVYFEYDCRWLYIWAAQEHGRQFPTRQDTICPDKQPRVGCWWGGRGGGCTAIPFALFRLFFLQRILYGLHTMEVPPNISEVRSTYILLHCLDAVSFFCIYILLSGLLKLFISVCMIRHKWWNINRPYKDYKV